MTDIKEESNLYTTSSHLETMPDGYGRGHDVPSIEDSKSVNAADEDPNNPQVDTIPTILHTVSIPRVERLTDTETRRIGP